MAEIKRLEPELFDRALLTLTRSFHNDPMYEWILPDAAQRTRGIRHLHRIPLKYGLRHGYIAQSDGARAVAIWVPPGRAPSLGAMIRSGMLATPFRVGAGRFTKFMRAIGTLDEIHRRRAPEPHWYLTILGVDPELQGQGRGGALLNEGIERADRDAFPCYLETSKERNLRFYERHGFRVLESARLGEGGPEAWAMRREAAGDREHRGE